MEVPAREAAADASISFEAAETHASQPVTEECENREVPEPQQQQGAHGQPQDLSVSAYPPSQQTPVEDESAEVSAADEQPVGLGAAADSIAGAVPVPGDFVVHPAVPPPQPPPPPLAHLGPHMSPTIAVTSAGVSTPPVPAAYAVAKDAIAELHLATHLVPGLAAMQHNAAPSALADPGLRAILPQTETGLYIPAPHLSGLAAGSLHYAAHQQQQQQDGAAGRKRSKTSRACDECRRRKSKCDAASDAGDAPCTNCRRVKAVCLFTRIPQKRGPSKGYIRELANRISGIESKLDGTERGLKRPFTTLAADDGPAESGRGNPWPETRPLLISAPPEKLHTLFAGSSSSAIGTVSPLPLSGLPPPPAAAAAKLNSPPLEPALDNPADFEIDHRVIDGYFAAIHPVLPLLPDTPAALQANLLRCPAALRDAFTDVLFAAVHSFPGHQSVPPGDLIRANLKLVSWQFSQQPQPQPQPQQLDRTIGLVYIQTLLLQAIQADNRAADEAGPDKTELLGRAAAQGVRMKLYVEPGGAGPDAQMQEDRVLRARVWRCLVVMDRWHSVGMGQQPLVGEEHVVATHALRRVLPTQLFYMTRLNSLLSLASAIITCLADAPSSVAKPSAADIALGAALGPWAERFREDLPDDVTPATHPVLHMSYWHARLLTQLVGPNASLGGLLWPCRELVGLLCAHTSNASCNSNSSSSSSSSSGSGSTSSKSGSALFAHHFLVLVALVLRAISLSVDSHDTPADAALRHEAGRLLARVLAQPHLAPHWLGRVRSAMAASGDGGGEAGEDGREAGDGAGGDGAGDGDGTERALASPAIHATAALTLRKLADLMASDAGTEPDGPAYPALGFDRRAILRSGYLRGIP